MMSARRTVEEWESHVGGQVRELRLRADLTQDQLAHRADVSLPTIQRLESGKGSTLGTLVRVVRALDRADWLDDLAPITSISPMDLLRQRRGAPGQRRRASGRADDR